jgi:hypothetical protein
MNTFLKELIVTLAVVVGIVGAIVGYFAIVKHDKQQPTQPEQSMRTAMDVWVDVGTGCHYLKAGSGTLVPRMLPTGRQVCN